MTSEKLFLLSRTKLAIIRKADVLTARDQIEKVFLQIRTGAGDGVDFVPANHFRQRNAEFRGAHGARERDHHFSAAIQMRDVSLGGIFQRCRVEMPEMPINERDETAEERERDEPQQAMICARVQRGAEKVEFSKKSGKWRDACQ